MEKDRLKPIIGKYVYRDHKSALTNCGQFNQPYPESDVKDGNGDCIRGQNRRIFNKKRLWGSREDVYRGRAVLTRGGLSAEDFACQPRGESGVEVLKPGNSWGPRNRVGPKISVNKRRKMAVRVAVPGIIPASQLPANLREVPAPPLEVPGDQ